MKPLSPLAQRIMERSEGRLHSRFPTADINKLTSDADERGRLHGRIEMYLSGIAGYAASADRLSRRSQDELEMARQFLSRPFFEKHQEYADYRSKITEHETPDLFWELRTAELNRDDLLQEVERLLKPNGETETKP